MYWMCVWACFHSVQVKLLPGWNAGDKIRPSVPFPNGLGLGSVFPPSPGLELLTAVRPSWHPHHHNQCSSALLAAHSPSSTGLGIAASTWFSFDTRHRSRPGWEASISACRCALHVEILGSACLRSHSSLATKTRPCKHTWNFRWRHFGFRAYRMISGSSRENFRIALIDFRR